MKPTAMHLSRRICGGQTAMSSIQFWGIIEQRVYQTKVQDANDRRQCVGDVWAGVKWSDIDNAIA